MGPTHPWLLAILPILVIETPFEFWISTPSDENINTSIIYQFYKVFILLEIKVILISCSLSKGGFKGCREQWLDGFDEPPLSPLLTSTLAGVGNWANRWRLPPIRAVREGNLADGVFLLWNRSTRRIFFYWNTTIGNNSSTDVSLVR